MAGPRNATTTNRGRTYKWRDEEFDSVTTIINGGVPKPALTNWAAKTVAEFAFDQLGTWNLMERDEAVDWLKRSPYRTSSKAAAQGSDIHAWAEAHVLGQPVPDPPLLQKPYCEGFLRWIEEFEPTFEMTEATVYSRRFRYAGTLDAIATIDGERWLLDYKTGKGVYGEVAMQLAAYRHAEFIGLADGTEVPMPEVDRVGVLHVTPTGCVLIPVRAGEEELRFFRYAQQIRHFAEVVSREVLEAPVVRESREAVSA